MTPYADNFIPIVLMEDELVHSDQYPFCSLDPACPCHEDRELIGIVSDAVTNGLLTCEEASLLVAGRLL